MIKRLATLFVILGAILVGGYYSEVHIDYKEAVNCFENGQYVNATKIFRRLKDYKDSPEMVIESLYQSVAELNIKNDYEGAKKALDELGDYKDVKLLYRETDYLHGDYFIREQIEYRKAVDIFSLTRG